MLSSGGDGAFDRGHNALMGAAAAKVAGQGFLNLLVARIFVFGQQSGGRHDHAVDAIAALTLAKTKFGRFR